MVYNQAFCVGGEDFKLKCGMTLGTTQNSSVNPCSAGTVYIFIYKFSSKFQNK